MNWGFVIAMLLLPLASGAWIKLRDHGRRKTHEKRMKRYERELGAWLLNRIAPIPGGDSGGRSGKRRWWRKTRK